MSMPATPGLPPPLAGGGLGLRVGGGGGPGPAAGGLNPVRYGNGGAQSAEVLPMAMPATGRVGQAYPGPTGEPEPGQRPTEPPALLDWDNPFLAVSDDPLSTFSIDVDTASYSIIRRLLREGRRPGRDYVRIEEMVNYFETADPAPEDGRPFAAKIEWTQAPWKPKHQLLRIGLKGRELDMSGKQDANLVFLLDVSGSMQSPDKLPLLKQGMKLLVEQLGENDRVTLVVYAGASGLVLPTTYAHEQQTILDALERLEAGGSTNGGDGIRLAYEMAEGAFIEGGVNRVILATDGDFNVGITDRGDLQALIEEKAKTGVFLSVLGFGIDNLQDGNLETLADKGNGNYAYVDSLQEARRVLVEEIGGTLVTIAKDVKLQLEFNPARVAGYRLIGYENRLLQAQDFNDDSKDAGEIGAGHSVTAFYELVPAGLAFEAGEAFTPVVSDAAPLEESDDDAADAGTANDEPEGADVDPLRYGSPEEAAALASEILTLKLRYKLPDGNESTRFDLPLQGEPIDLQAASDDLRFGAAVAAFGMILRDSRHRGDASFDSVLTLARSGLGADPKGYRTEFLELVEAARQLGVEGSPSSP